MVVRLTYLRDALRRELDEFISLENVKVDVIKLIMNDFTTHLSDYLGLLDHEKALCKALGK